MSKNQSLELLEVMLKPGVKSDFGETEERDKVLKGCVELIKPNMKSALPQDFLHM